MLCRQHELGALADAAAATRMRSGAEPGPASGEEGVHRQEVPEEAQEARGRDSAGGRHGRSRG